jgi:hypothetical protein
MMLGFDNQMKVGSGLNVDDDDNESIKERMNKKKLNRSSGNLRVSEGKSGGLRVSEGKRPKKKEGCKC